MTRIWPNLSTWIALALVCGLVAAAARARAQTAWVTAKAPASPAGLFDIGAVPSTNISASIDSGIYFVTDLGAAPSGVFRRIRNAGPNTIPFVMDGKKIVGYAPTSPVGGPGGSGASHVLPLAPDEVAEFVSLGDGSWQLVQYLPLAMENFGLQAGYAAAGILPTSPVRDNWFQLGPIAGKGPQPDYAFAVNWSGHGGKVHTHGAYLMLPGDTPNIEFRQADIDPADESPKPWTRAPHLGAHISGRALVDVGGGVFDFCDNTKPACIGFRRGPSYLYQGFTANIDFPLTQPPTAKGDGGALVFKITRNNTVTPFQRGWFAENGNFVEIGKAAIEACGIDYPYNWRGKGIWQADAPCNDSDYFDTEGWGNISLIATDYADGAHDAHNAALAIRQFGAHDEGLDIGMTAAPGVDVMSVHAAKRTPVIHTDPATSQLTYPAQAAFVAYVSAASPRVTGDGARHDVVFNSATANRGLAYDPSTGVFTAPVAGLYQVDFHVQLTGLARSHSAIQGQVKESAGPAYATFAGRGNPDAGGTQSIAWDGLVPMSAGDTISVSILVSGGAKTVGIGGGVGADAGRSTFSARLVE